MAATAPAADSRAGVTTSRVSTAAATGFGSELWSVLNVLRGLLAIRASSPL